MRHLLIGRTFGRLTVVGDFMKGRKHHCECVCSCGKKTDKPVSGALLSGNTKSCGCLQKERLSKGWKHTLSPAGLKRQMDRVKAGSRRTHGMTKTPEYKVWEGIKTRCYNPNFKQFNDYGGRGIKVCDRWLNSFENFFEDMGEKPIGLSIDRFPNNDGNYEPRNCRWATAKQQRHNRRPMNKRRPHGVPATS